MERKIMRTTIAFLIASLHGGEATLSSFAPGMVADADECPGDWLGYPDCKQNMHTDTSYLATSSQMLPSTSLESAALVSSLLTIMAVP